jgi:hypothetical protein
MISATKAETSSTQRKVVGLDGYDLEIVEQVEI